MIPPPKFNSSPLKNGGKGRRFFSYLGFGNFSGVNFSGEITKYIQICIEKWLEITTYIQICIEKMVVYHQICILKTVFFRLPGPPFAEKSLWIFVDLSVPSDIPQRSPGLFLHCSPTCQSFGLEDLHVGREKAGDFWMVHFTENSCSVGQMNPPLKNYV